MYITKIFVDNQLMGVKMYDEYEHALSDIVGGNLGLKIHGLKLVDFSSPKIVPTSSDVYDFNIDFEFHYLNGLMIRIEEIVTEEDYREDNKDNEDDK